MPILEIHVDSPAGALIIFVDTRTTRYDEAVEVLDDLARQQVEPGDQWIYYFDTLSDGTLYFTIRCSVDSFNLPVRERICQTSQFQPGQVPASYLYDHGFVSADSQ